MGNLGMPKGPSGGPKGPSGGPKKFYRHPDAVTYGRVRGSAESVRDEVGAVLKAIKDVRCGAIYCEKVPYLLGHDMPDEADVSCRARHSLQNNLARDGRPDLQERVIRLSDQFRRAVEYTNVAGTAISVDDLFRIFGEMERQDPPVLPDICVVNAAASVYGTREDYDRVLERMLAYGIPADAKFYQKWLSVCSVGCKTWSDYDRLYERINKYKLPADMNFFNRCLSACSTFQEVGWVCERAKIFGFPDMNHGSRGIVLKFINSGIDAPEGSSRVAELSSLREYFEERARCANGGIWSYLAKETNVRLENFGYGYAGIQVQKGPTPPSVSASRPSRRGPATGGRRIIVDMSDLKPRNKRG